MVLLNTAYYVDVDQRHRPSELLMPRNETQQKKRAIEPHYSQSHKERTVKAVVQEEHLY